MATTTEVLAEEDDPEVLTMTSEASIEETEDTTRLSDRLQQGMRRCVYGQPEVSLTTTEASIEETEDTTHLSEHLQPQRRRCVYGLRVLTMTTAALAD